MPVRIRCVAVDSRDPAAIARFWASALGWRVTFEEPDEVAVEPPEGTSGTLPYPDLLFVTVPEDKQIKNRLHLDLRPDDQGAEVARLEQMGARRVDIGQSADVSWVVMADPEGNEFCVLRALSAEEEQEGETQ